MSFLSYRTDKSRAIISKMLSLCSNPYLALSFGKDSVVMLDLVREQFPDIPCLFLKSEESFLMYNYEEVIRQYRDMGVKVEIVETMRLTEHGFDWEKARKAGNKDFFLEPFFRGWDGVFMGLRIEESKPRKMTLTKKINNEVGDKIMRYKSGRRHGMHRCCPMAYWKSHEVLAYINKKKLPCLDIYSQGAHIRTTARLTGDSVRQNTLFWIQKNKPENWNKLVAMLPELKYYK